MYRGELKQVVVTRRMTAKEKLRNNGKEFDIIIISKNTNKEFTSQKDLDEYIKRLKLFYKNILGDKIYIMVHTKCKEN